MEHFFVVIASIPFVLGILACVLAFCAFGIFRALFKKFFK